MTGRRPGGFGTRQPRFGLAGGSGRAPSGKQVDGVADAYGARSGEVRAGAEAGEVAEAAEVAAVVSGDGLQERRTAAVSVAAIAARRSSVSRPYLSASEGTASIAATTAGSVRPHSLCSSTAVRASRSGGSRRCVSGCCRTDAVVAVSDGRPPVAMRPGQLMRASAWVSRLTVWACSWSPMSFGAWPAQARACVPSRMRPRR